MESNRHGAKKISGWGRFPWRWQPESRDMKKQGSRGLAGTSGVARVKSIKGLSSQALSEGTGDTFSTLRWVDQLSLQHSAGPSSHSYDRNRIVHRLHWLASQPGALFAIYDTLVFNPSCSVGSVSAIS